MKSKFFVCMLLTAAMLVQLTACGGSGTKSTNAPETGGGTAAGGETQSGGAAGAAKIGEIPGYTVTSDQITLRYWHVDDETLITELANAFMDAYPNITVEQFHLSDNPLSDLSAAAQTGTFPDAFTMTDVDGPLLNQYWGDMTEYYDADPESQNLMPTINEYGIGMFETNTRFAVPSNYSPCTMYIDRAVMQKLNLEMPPLDWTWSEMIDLVKKATADNVDSMKYYGLGFYNRLDSLYGITAANGVKGEFGFNGKNFDLSYWAIGETEFSNLRIDGYVAPATETPAIEAWTGDYNAWCGTTGHVAIFSEAFWTYMNLWGQEGYQERYGLDIVPYVTPAVEGGNSEHNILGSVTMAGISSATDYPYEAYLLCKFMNWGVDGWKTRLEIYNDESKVASDGLPLKNSGMPMPLTLDEEVWAGYKALFPDYEEDKEYWDAFFSTVTRPIPFGWMSIAGYWNACDQYFNDIGIHDLSDAGIAQAADYVDEATQKFNYYHAIAMLDYFGPSGYDILSDEEVAMYEQMEKDNS